MYQDAVGGRADRVFAVPTGGGAEIVPDSSGVLFGRTTGADGRTDVSSAQISE